MITIAKPLSKNLEGIIADTTFPTKDNNAIIYLEYIGYCYGGNYRQFKPDVPQQIKQAILTKLQKYQ
jgi:hypothetical protein